MLMPPTVHSPVKTYNPIYPDYNFDSVLSAWNFALDQINKGDDDFIWWPAIKVSRVHQRFKGPYIYQLVESHEHGLIYTFILHYIQCHRPNNL
jgi:hypothetical protein